MMHNKITLLREASDFDEALTLTGRELEAWPARSGPYVDSGVVLQDLGRVDDAIGVLEAGVRVDPRSSDLRRGLAQALSRQERFAEAGRQYEEMRRIDPDNPVGHLGLAKTALEVGDILTAERIFEEQSRRPPDEAALRIVLGDLAALLKHPDTAREHYLAALAGASDRGAVWLKIGQIELGRGALPAARDALMEAVSQRNASAEAHRQLAVVLDALGDQAAAAAQYRSALAIEADDRAAPQQPGVDFGDHAVGRLGRRPRGRPAG